MYDAKCTSVWIVAQAVYEINTQMTHCFWKTLRYAADQSTLYILMTEVSDSGAMVVQ